MNKSNFKSLSLFALAIVLVFLAFKILPSNKSNNESVATVSAQSSTIIDSGNLATAAATNAPKSVSTKWQTNNYPTGAGVDINLIRKVNTSPAEFQFVRKVAQNTTNDGEETWGLLPNETGDLYIEVTCSSSYQFKSGCSIGSSPIKLTN